MRPKSYSVKSPTEWSTTSCLGLTHSRAYDFSFWVLYMFRRVLSRSGWAASVVVPDRTMGFPMDTTGASYIRILFTWPFDPVRPSLGVERTHMPLFWFMWNLWATATDRVDSINTVGHGVVRVATTKKALKTCIQSRQGPDGYWRINRQVTHQADEPWHKGWRIALIHPICGPVTVGK